MFWYHQWMGGGTGLLMMGSGILLWAGLVAAAALAISGIRGRRPDRGTAEQILGQRYARGELDDGEYRHRMDELRQH